MKVIISAAGTGGHINPGIAIANKIKEKEPNSEIVFFGTTRGLENDLVPRAGYKLKTIEAYGLSKKISIDNMKKMCETLKATSKARKIIKEFKPDVVIGAGGYICGPVVWAAKKENIPVALHESNAFPGKAVKFLAKKADVVLISFEEARERIHSAKKIVFTGTPVKTQKKEYTQTEKNQILKNAGLKTDKPVVLIFGGSQGAQRINEAIVEIIKQEANEEYQIMWATGPKQYEIIKEKLEEEALNKKLEEEKIDITLSGTSIPSGSPSIIEKIVEETEEFFIGMGYDVLEGPEIELDKYNFEMLNLPKDHPARDAQDTYYLEGENILLRSQTSPVQVRTMLKGEGKTPIRMICPGKTYRREDINATHEQEFTQIEGLVIDKNISLSDLKGTFDAFIKNMFGEGVEARFRPSYYPFTEPSVEMDMSCIYCDGSGCSMCKPKGWITICGGGMVHPNVLKACGYDPNEWQGFAFGMAAERISMLKYGITDMRVCHENDLRETRNFDRKEIR